VFLLFGFGLEDAMSDENTLEAVGRAEDVIARLVNERRSLENAQQVLRTYRMVKSEMEPALAELDGVKKSVLEARRDLEAIEGQKASALVRVREEVDRFRSEQMEQIEAEIETKRALLENVKGEYESVKGNLEGLKVSYAGKLDALRKETAVATLALESAKKEHGVLAEAIAKAAGFFAKGRE
jgi:DNA repair exonuclease SbcCD ATPase subunit